MNPTESAEVFAVSRHLHTGKSFFLQNEARLDNFELTPAGTVDPAVVLHEPGWSLYGLHHDRLLFVATDPAISLAQAAFLTYTQNTHAQRLLSMPLATALHLAEQVPEPRQHVLLFMTARSGSTLLNQILSRLDGVASFSEPGTFRHLARLCDAAGTAADCSQRMRACFKLQGLAHPGDTLGIKLRHRSLDDIAHYQRAFPSGRFIFMYREATAWMKSMYRMLLVFMTDDSTPPDTTMPPGAIASERLRAIWQQISGEPTTYFETHPTYGYLEELLAILWSRLLEKYSAALAAGVPFLAIRYDQLADQRQQTLERVLRYCGLSLDTLDQAMHAYAQHSQAETPLTQQQVPVSDAHIARFRAMLAQQPYTTPDVWLPDCTTDTPAPEPY